jgi:hypothetical protein
MALGRRGGVEDGLWIPTTELPRSPGHPFYQRVNRVLAEAGFDRFVEDLCRARGSAGSAVDSAGYVFPDADGGLLRRDRLATRDRLAL